MFHQQTIRTRLLTAFLGISTVTIVVLSALSYFSSKHALTTSVENQLVSIREAKASQIEAYFENIHDQVVTFSEDRMIVEAMQAFKEAFDALEQTPLYRDELPVIASTNQRFYNEHFVPTLSQNTHTAYDEAAFRPGSNASHYLQYHYISNNPHPLGSKDNLDAADDQSTYSRHHATYHPVLRNFLQTFGYYDIFLIDHETGHIVYSVFKEVDYATSLLTGPYRSTNFADVFRAAREASAPDFTRLEDFAPYTPSYNAPASFIASPIFDGNQKIGVLVFQMPIDNINDVMTHSGNWEASGLGETGETYIVGADKKMRSMSRFLAEDPAGYLAALQQAGVPTQTLQNIEANQTSILFQDVHTPASEAALLGQSGTQVVHDYRNEPVLSAYMPLAIADVNWALLAELDTQEAFAPIHRLALRMGLGTVLIFLVALGVSFILSRRLTQPLVALQESAERIAQGHKNVHVDLNRTDEFGAVAKAFNQMVASIQTSENDLLAEKASIERKVEEAVASSEAQKRYLATSVDEMVSAMQRFEQGDLTVKLPTTRDGEIGQLFQGFNQAVHKIRHLLVQVLETVEATSSAAYQINQTTESLAAGAQEQSAQAGDVAAAMEEMTQTVSENATHAATTAKASRHSGGIAQEGSQIVQRTIAKIHAIAQIMESSTATVERLGHSSSEVGSIVSVIKDIADQTNLLALNAAIEAARAGEHGKGFAVVADEVRQLAARTTEATQEIEQTIQAIQQETQQAVIAIGQGKAEVSDGLALADEADMALNRVVQEAENVIEGVNHIAAASEEQAVTSQEVARNVQAIYSVSQEAAQGVTEIASAAESLSQLTADLHTLVQSFKVGSNAPVRPAVDRKHSVSPRRSRLPLSTY